MRYWSGLIGLAVAAFAVAFIVGTLAGFGAWKATGDLTAGHCVSTAVAVLLGSVLANVWAGWWNDRHPSRFR